MDATPILSEQRTGYRVITLNQPERLNAFNERFCFLHLRAELVNHGLAFAGKLHKGLHIIELLLYLPIEFEAFFEAGALLVYFTGTCLVGPEAGVHDLFLQFVELTLFRAGVKETSARPRCAFSID